MKPGLQLFIFFIAGLMSAAAVFALRLAYLQYQAKGTSALIEHHEKTLVSPGCRPFFFRYDYNTSNLRIVIQSFCNGDYQPQTKIFDLKSVSDL